ncbi:MAG TPA: PQQ-binding-like beta-propeller repeat protein [Methylomirabilota bacterium]|nr:PQQ-binding-like beta-propeller repeat protein [Methylomirabilota bacterium]
MQTSIPPACDRAPMRHALLNVPPEFLSRTTLLVGAILLAAAVPFAAAGSPATGGWSQWRGPMNTGVAPEANPPLRWSETENVKWKVAIPGFGTSTPIIRDNQVFILTAIPTGRKTEASAATTTTDDAAEQEGQGGRRGRGGFGGEPPPDEIYQFVVLSLDRQTGRTLWQKVAREQVPHEGHHQDHGFASASPITDGDVLIVSFGSRGIYGYDLQGNLKWEKDLGDMQTRLGFGEGSSPALHGDTVVVLWDHEGDDDFLVTLDKNTGAKTGEPHFDAERLEDIRGIYASPVGAADRVYVLGRDGTCLVLKKGTTPEVLATNKLDDNTDASIAIVGRDLFIRGHKTLYCLTGE